ncbi:MAG: hypothetical protein C0490_04835 [Marivirga sp.]|nr:hypothetical protein [Marivirga sp.]
MKTVRTVLGIKKIEDNDHQVTVLKLREILDAHRGTLITRLISDLPSYIDYKFNTKVNSQQLEIIKEKLSFMKNSSVDMDKYGFILQDVLSHENTYVATGPFYKEIDDNIGWYLNESQLKLVR